MVGNFVHTVSNFFTTLYEKLTFVRFLTALLKNNMWIFETSSAGYLYSQSHFDIHCAYQQGHRCTSGKGTTMRTVK